MKIEKRKTSQTAQGHRQRLRQRFISSGLDGFHDYEVIELLLTLATPRKDCKQAAKAALSAFKTLPAVLEAPIQELCEIEGIGSRNAMGIRLVKAVAERYFKKKLIHKDIINNSKQLFDYLYHSLRDKTREYFKIIFLDAKNRVVTTEDHSRGTLTGSSVYPREVIHAALRHAAAALIFAHNHPSGDVNPSPEDVAITRQLVFAGKVMGIAVHEHIIIGGDDYFSFADQGYISRMGREFDAMYGNTP